MYRKASVCICMVKLQTFWFTCDAIFIVQFLTFVFGLFVETFFFFLDECAQCV